MAYTRYTSAATVTNAVRYSTARAPNRFRAGRTRRPGRRTRRTGPSRGRTLRGPRQGSFQGSRPGTTRSFHDSMKTRLQVVGHRSEHLRPGQRQCRDQDQDRRYQPRRTTRLDNESVPPSAFIAACLPGSGKRSPQDGPCGPGESREAGRLLASPGSERQRCAGRTPHRQTRDVPWPAGFG
jgi:hypothetical protein